MTRMNCKYGINCYRKNPKHFEEYCHPCDRDWKRLEDEVCPCGGGQSCMVDRRSLGDWVPEDIVFKKNNLPLRKNCFSALTKEQEKVLKRVSK